MIGLPFSLEWGWIPLTKADNLECGSMSRLHLSELSYQCLWWLTYWLITYPLSGHYLNQCSLMNDKPLGMICNVKSPNVISYLTQNPVQQWLFDFLCLVKDNSCSTYDWSTLMENRGLLVRSLSVKLGWGMYTILRSHGKEMLSVSLVLCEGNPPVTGGFPSQRTSNVELFCLFVVGLN